MQKRKEGGRRKEEQKKKMKRKQKRKKKKKKKKKNKIKAAATSYVDFAPHDGNKTLANFFPPSDSQRWPPCLYRFTRNCGWSQTTPQCGVKGMEGFGDPP